MVHLVQPFYNLKFLVCLFSCVLSLLLWWNKAYKNSYLAIISDFLISLEQSIVLSALIIYFRERTMMLVFTIKCYGELKICKYLLILFVLTNYWYFFSISLVSLYSNETLWTKKKIYVGQYCQGRIVAYVYGVQASENNLWVSM